MKEDNQRFRVYDQKNNRYYDESYFCLNGVGNLLYWKDEKYYNSADELMVVVEFSTGIRDNSNQLCFENDIVEIQSGKEKNEYQVLKDVKKGRYTLTNLKNGSIHSFSEKGFDNFKIVGNIHDICYNFKETIY